MKKLMATALALAAFASSSSAILYTTNWSDSLNPATPFVNGGVIPDGNLSGWADSRNVTTMPAGTLTSVAVTLNIAGGWNGDLYAYLIHGGGFCVLLDGVGPGDFGYGDSGMNVILADAGVMTTLGQAPNQSINDYQTYQGAGIPSGTWNPQNTSGSLASFLGTSPNGTWSLFIADRNSGDVATVSNWGLELDIVAVPEVEAWVAAALAGAFGACWISRQIKPGKL